MLIRSYSAKTILRALRDAVEWQESIMDSMTHMKDDPAYLEAVKQKTEYLDLLNYLRIKYKKSL